MRSSQWPARWQPASAWPKQVERDLHWQAQAACRDVDDATSDQLVGATMTGDAADVVAALCERCRVARECLAAGQEWKADGVWGGQVLDDGQVAPVRQRAAS